mmetsp:Transcript_87648/g.107423  ORF Transcript_87648/g.107423 Transcript_87648/m.107423 type:complete len:222 (+) Transcript_87648:76-741(+)
METEGVTAKQPTTQTKDIENQQKSGNNSSDNTAKYAAIYHAKSNAECPCENECCTCHCCGLCVLITFIIFGIINIIMTLGTINAINNGVSKNGNTQWISNESDNTCTYIVTRGNGQEFKSTYEGITCDAFIPAYTAQIVVTGVTIVVSIIGVLGIWLLKEYLVLAAILIPLASIFGSVWLMIVASGNVGILVQGIISICINLAVAYLFYKNYELIKEAKKT